MVSINIKTNAAEVADLLNKVTAKQLPFATAVALTKTALDVRDELRQDANREFTLRNRFSERGININRANKRDWPRPFAEIGVERNRSYLIDHITGNRSRKAAGGKRVAIPDTEGTWPRKTAAVKLTATGKVPKSKQVSRLKQAKRRAPFIVRSRKGNDLLVRRMTRERDSLEVLYAFRKSVKIDRRWRYADVAAAEARAKYPGQFRKAFEQAIRTPKPARTPK